MNRRATTTTTTTTSAATSPTARGAAPPEDLELREGGRRLAPVAGTRAADLDVRRALLWWRGYEHQLRTRGEELHGIGPALEEAAAAVDEVLRRSTPRTTGDVFAAVAEGFAGVPGVPALMAPWFAEFARSGGGDVTTHDLADAAEAGLEAVQRAGGPAPGAGSLVDAMAPAAEALVGADVAEVPVVAALNAAYRAAANGTRRTAVRGVVDPGALAVTWFFERGTVV
ncbi:DAK2 domain-containing protein [Kineococcus aurantiacus]|uniref:DhaL domain-containing protein n=1 Tax=Kineococcus aurantiacus TaxID=37633 RepID=A0A7Y9J115_9ACTN|nr:hypothetical protein [Kineococcus aurantiacus]